MTSPCVGLCTISDSTGWCYGCLRTLEEIAAWRLLSVEEKSKLIDKLVHREINEADCSR